MDIHRECEQKLILNIDRDAEYERYLFVNQNINRECEWILSC